jgi:hypothetical protein
MPVAALDTLRLYGYRNNFSTLNEDRIVLVGTNGSFDKRDSNVRTFHFTVARTLVTGRATELGRYGTTP